MTDAYLYRLRKAVENFEKKRPDEAAELQRATMVQFGRHQPPPTEPGPLRTLFEAVYFELVRERAGWPDERTYTLSGVSPGTERRTTMSAFPEVPSVSAVPPTLEG